MFNSHSFDAHFDFNNHLLWFLKKPKHILILCCSLILGACSDDNLPDYSNLVGLRVMSVLSDKSEAHPGDSVQTRVLLSDVGASDSLQLSLKLCRDPGVGVGAEPTCDNSTILSQQSAAVSFDTATDVNSADRVGLSQAFSFTMPSSAVSFLYASTPMQYNGVPHLIDITLTSGSRQVKAFKRIFIVNASLRSALNQNPQSLQILSSGVVLSAIAQNSTMNLSMSSSSPETYSAMNNAGAVVSVTEKLQTTWFATDGEFKYFRTEPNDSTEWKLGAVDTSTRSVHLIGVTRDSRGGAAFVHLKTP